MALKDFSDSEIIAVLEKFGVNPWATSFKKTEKPKLISALRSLDAKASFGSEFTYDLGYDWMRNRILKLRVWGPTEDDPDLAYRTIEYGG